MANTKVTGDVIANGTISTVHLADDAITAAKLDSTATGITFADLTVDTDTLYVDAANNRVGIGITSPDKKLHIVDTSAGAVTYPLRLQNSGTTVGTDVGLIFTTKTSGGGSASSTIRSESEDTSGNSRLVFTTPSGGSTSERMRIDSSGDVTMQGGRIYLKESDLGNTAIALTRDADEGYVQLFSSGSQTIEIRGNGNSYFNGGNVGIGRTDPNARLDIKGTGGSTGLTFETSDASNNQTFYINDGGRAGMQYYPFTIGMASSTSAASGARFQVATTGGDFVVLNDGKVGIGTTSPDYKLTVNGSVNNVFTYSTGANDQPGFVAANNTTTGTSTNILYNKFYGPSVSATVFGTNIANYALIGTEGSINNGILLGTLTAKPLIIGTNNAERMRITSGGDVGIGTDSPNEKLTVDGNIESLDTFVLKNSGGHKYQQLFQNTNDFVIRYNNSSSWFERMRINSSGNVGINVTSPQNKLAIAHSVSGDSRNLLLANKNDTNGDSVSIGFSMLDNNTYVKSGIFFERTTTQGRGSLHLAVNNEVNSNNVTKSDAKLTINNAGNVGIGTTSPTQLLTVWGGNVYLRGGDSKVIINNIAGASNNEDILFQRNDSTQFSLGLNSSDSFTLFGSSTSTSRLTVNSSGNVGIGTTSPAAKLQVNGDIGIGEMNSTRSTNVRFAKNDVNVITFTITVGAIGAWRPGSCWIQVSGSQNGLQEYYSAWYFIRLTHYYASGVAGQGTSNPSCILDSGGDTNRVTVGVIGSNNISTHQEITITLTDVGATTNSMVADINCTMQVGIESIT